MTIRMVSDGGRYFNQGNGRRGIWDILALQGAISRCERRPREQEKHNDGALDYPQYDGILGKLWSEALHACTA